MWEKHTFQCLLLFLAVLLQFSSRPEGVAKEKAEHQGLHHKETTGGLFFKYKFTDFILLLLLLFLSCLKKQICFTFNQTNQIWQKRQCNKPTQLALIFASVRHSSTSPIAKYKKSFFKVKLLDDVRVLMSYLRTGSETGSLHQQETGSWLSQSSKLLKPQQEFWEIRRKSKLSLMNDFTKQLSTN